MNPFITIKKTQHSVPYMMITILKGEVRSDRGANREIIKAKQANSITLRKVSYNDCQPKVFGRYFVRAKVAIRVSELKNSFAPQAAVATEAFCCTGAELKEIVPDEMANDRKWLVPNTFNTALFCAQSGRMIGKHTGLSCDISPELLSITAALYELHALLICFFYRLVLCWTFSSARAHAENWLYADEFVRTAKERPKP